MTFVLSLWPLMFFSNRHDHRTASEVRRQTSTRRCDNRTSTQALIACSTWVIHVSLSAHNEGMNRWQLRAGLRSSRREDLAACVRTCLLYIRVCTLKKGGKGVRGLTHPLSVAVGGSRGGKADTVHQSGRGGRHRHPHLLWFLTASQPPQTQPDSSRRSRIARKQDSTRSFFFPPFVLPQLWMKEKKHFWVSGEKEQEWREIRGSATQNSKREDEGDNKKREGSEGGEWEENKTMQSQSVQTSARWKTSEKRRKQDKTKGGRVSWREEWEETLTRVYSRASS